MRWVDTAFLMTWRPIMNEWEQWSAPSKPFDNFCVRAICFSQVGFIGKHMLSHLLSSLCARPSTNDLRCILMYQLKPPVLRKPSLRSSPRSEPLFFPLIISYFWGGGNCSSYHNQTWLKQIRWLLNLPTV